MKKQKIYLENMLDSIKKIEKYSKGLDLEKFFENEMVIDACITQLAHLGETVRKMKDEFGDNLNLPYGEMIGLRNLIAHDYLGISFSMIFSIIEIDLPELKIKLIKCLEIS